MLKITTTTTIDDSELREWWMITFIATSHECKWEVQRGEADLDAPKTWYENQCVNHKRDWWSSAALVTINYQ